MTFNIVRRANVAIVKSGTTTVSHVRVEKMMELKLKRQIVSFLHLVKILLLHVTLYNPVSTFPIVMIARRSISY